MIVNSIIHGIKIKHKVMTVGQVHNTHDIVNVVCTTYSNNEIKYTDL